MKSNQNSPKRPSAVAGKFFPDDPTVLHETVEACITKGEAGWRPPRSTADAIISPHAAYQFSGWLAGAAWRSTARLSRKRIVVLSPSHHHAFRGIALPYQSAYEMPGFDVPLDEEACFSLVKAGLVHILDEAHDREHGIETQLGFLKRLHPDAKVIPLVIGTTITQTVARVIDHLANMRPKPLFVLSSDLSHFHSLEEAQRRDLETAHLIETGRYPDMTSTHACGAQAIAGYMASKEGGAQRVQRLAMANSHAVSGDESRTVGYGAWAFFNPHDEDILLPVHRRTLLRVAREALGSRLKNGKTPYVDVPGFATQLQGCGATFVTLQTKEGRLRGCIGSLTPHQPLARDVVENAVKSGFNDLRFRPLTAQELPEITIKIAVLSQPRPMQFSNEDDLLDQLIQGRDGLILSDQGKRGTFLPMVWNSLPEPKAFLEGLKVKAGLPKDHWSDTLQVACYKAENFGEGDEAI